MKRITWLLSLLFFILNFNSSAQTCTSSGGDDVLIDEPFRFRCGTSRMRDHYKKTSGDYRLIESCSDNYTDGNYYSKEGKIYFSPTYGEHQLVDLADAKSFKCKNGITRDKNNIFFMGKVVDDVDQSSFKSIGHNYCGDDNAVYYRGKDAEEVGLIKVMGAHQSSFKLIGEEYSYYAKDDQSAYFSGKAIEASDPTTFELLDYGYAKDKNYVYYNGVVIEGMNGNGFTILKDSYLGSDGVRLCNGSQVLENSDAKSLKAMGCGYYKDNNNVYLNGSILENVDSKSFEILTWGYTKDKDAVYCDLIKIEGANPVRFEVLGRKYSKDNNNIYYLHQTVACDYNSFELDTRKDYLAKDKNGAISRGVRE